MALDERGGVRPAHQLHVAGPGPAQGHHEHPDAMLLPVGAHIPQAAPVHLPLLSGGCLEAHCGAGLPTAAARRHVALQGGVPAVIAHCLELPVQYHAVFQPLGQALPDIVAILVLLSLSKGSIPAAAGAWASWTPGISSTGEPCCGRCPGPRQSPGWNGPPLSSHISLFTSRTFSKICQAPPRSLGG